MGAMGLFGLPIAEEYGGMGGDYFALCLALEELARVDSSVAITLEAGVSLGAMPIYRFGTEEQKREWLPALAAGERARRVRPHRARRRLRRGRHPHHGPARRRRVGDQRLQGVHHQLRHRHHLGRHDHRAHRRPRRRRPPRDLRDHRARGHAGLPGVAEVLQGRLERLGHPRAVLRRRARARGEPRRRARPRLRPVPLDPRRGPRRDRGAGHRARAGLRRRVGALRPRPAGVRPAPSAPTRPSSS